TGPKGTVFSGSPWPENEASPVLTPKPPGSFGDLFGLPSSPLDNPVNMNNTKSTAIRILSRQVDRSRGPFMSMDLHVQGEIPRHANVTAIGPLPSLDHADTLQSELPGLRTSNLRSRHKDSESRGGVYLSRDMNLYV